MIIYEILMSLGMENRKIVGLTTSLIEIDENDAAAIVLLRNNPTINQFLSSQKEVSEQEQTAWILQNRAKNDNVYFKIVDKKTDLFKGTIALYSIENGAAEFGRFIATNPISAIESELLLLEFGFEHLFLGKIYCCTVKENAKVWQQHTKFGFQIVGEDFDERISQIRVLQEIQNADYQSFDYSKIKETLKRFAV
jgi:RimJ/RimL family protein N-acetyltransferase